MLLNFIENFDITLPVHSFFDIAISVQLICKFCMPLNFIKNFRFKVTVGACSPDFCEMSKSSVEFGSPRRVWVPKMHQRFYATKSADSSRGAAKRKNTPRKMAGFEFLDFSPKKNRVPIQNKGMIKINVTVVRQRVIELLPYGIRVTLF